jgi:hypothetical protein
MIAGHGYFSGCFKVDEELSISLRMSALLLPLPKSVERLAGWVARTIALSLCM